MIKVKIVEDEQGQYQNEQGKKFNLIACSWVKGQRANEFKEFTSLQDALEYYGLKYINAPIKEQGEE